MKKLKLSKKRIEKLVRKSKDRADLWTRFIIDYEVERMAEIGVWEGGLAAELLTRCEGIKKYYMIDPWRHLADWEKPNNKTDDRFEKIYQRAMRVTDFAKKRRSVLRGTTIEVIDKIPKESVDFLYIDGDHTLRGIVVDLVRGYEKVKPGGVVGGDDFMDSCWQHGFGYEPTLVFPVVIYFAEAVGATLFALPYGQFLLVKPKTKQGFRWVDLVGMKSGFGLKEVMKKNSLKAWKYQMLAMMGRVVGGGKIVKKITRF